ncbi:MAG: helix-turn-helix transcriptional regulator [Rhodospirillaceae bacterium]|nr:helix-turn-helix transcriptional regulator [Rhodospirillaceae bacterium]
MKHAKAKSGKIGGMDYVVIPENPFAYFNLPDADLLKARSDLQIRLLKLIKERKLTQREVGAILGVSQPHVSAIMAGRLKKASMETLMGYLNKLGISVEISMLEAKSAKSSARTLVTA